MKKLICFSIWGNDYRYLGGALQNIELAQYYYPDWICRFYVGKSTRQDFVDRLKSFENVEVVEMTQEGDWTGMIWRFYAASDDDVDVMISRDADSRIHVREVEAVNEWLSSDKDFHIMRDHNYHGVLILGGMWGARNGVISDLKSLTEQFESQNMKGTDQDFLGKFVFPKVSHTSLVHDEFHWMGGLTSNKFPVKSGVREEFHFVGQAYDGDGKVLDNTPHFFEYLNVIGGPKINLYTEYKNLHNES